MSTEEEIEEDGLSSEADYHGSNEACSTPVYYNIINRQTDRLFRLLHLLIFVYVKSFKFLLFIKIVLFQSVSFGTSVGDFRFKFIRNSLTLKL